jgi:hypothetical protein
MNRRSQPRGLKFGQRAFSGQIPLLWKDGGVTFLGLGTRPHPFSRTFLINIGLGNIEPLPRSLKFGQWALSGQIPLLWKDSGVTALGLGTTCMPYPFSWIRYYSFWINIGLGNIEPSGNAPRGVDIFSKLEYLKSNAKCTTKSSTSLRTAIQLLRNSLRQTYWKPGTENHTEIDTRYWYLTVVSYWHSRQSIRFATWRLWVRVPLILYLNTRCKIISIWKWNLRFFLIVSYARFRVGTRTGTMKFKKYGRFAAKHFKYSCIHYDKGVVLVHTGNIVILQLYFVKCNGVPSLCGNSVAYLYSVFLPPRSFCSLAHKRCGDLGPLRFHVILYAR